MSKIPLKIKSNSGTSTASPTIYYGETICQSVIKSTHKPCQNRAYYRDLDQKLVCGVHSKNGSRTELPPNPNAKAQIEQKLADDHAIITKAHKDNIEAGRRGNVICSKMKMMKAPEDHAGYMKIFPNYRHGDRKDGLGLPSLSPMNLGPIHHGQPNLPPSLNLENFHQGNKVFPPEVDSNNEPLPIFFETQLKFYEDPVGHRHKDVAQGKNAPVYSMWIDKQGQKHQLTYIQSRQFYCHFYEQLTSKSSDFQRLKDLIENGYNLQICGYDAYHVDQDIEKHYLDPSRPFGHELVLYTLLTHDPKTYPWKKHKTFDF